jgi:sporulation protein YlmC with PRC-barrel domain
MLRSISDMEGYAIGATDGIIGQVKDFYFDDEAWVIRYLVVEASEWSPRQRVLISPMAIGQSNWPERLFPVSLTQEQVKRSPDIDTDRPVSRQQEMGFLGYYSYPYYWGGKSLWGDGLYPGMMLAGKRDGGMHSVRAEAHVRNARGDFEADRNMHQHGDPHLRSSNAVMQYYVHASDGDIGHVQDLLVDDESWAIRYIIVNTSNWWMGHQVIVAPEWIADVNWLDSKVSVDLTRQAVKDSPPYDASASLLREQEVKTHAHYGRDGYWRREAKHDVGASR